MARIRTSMIDNEQLYTAKHYPRKEDKSVDLQNDIPNYFKFTYYEEKGRKREDTFVVPRRRATAESIMIKTDSELDFKPDHLVIIDGDSYNITSVQDERNASYDLRSVRGLATNKTKIMVLDE